MKHALILALLLVAGCKMADVENAASDAEKARHEMRQAAYEARRDSLKAASARAAAHADSVTAEQPMTAAKVAAVMQANDITLPQVVAFLYTYGFDVVSRSNTLRPHWSPAPPGRDAQGNIVPVAYYVANVRIAVGDTTLAVYAPQAVGPVWMRVKAYDGRGMSGIWSQTEVSGGGALLPGVAE